MKNKIKTTFQTRLELRKCLQDRYCYCCDEFAPADSEHPVYIPIPMHQMLGRGRMSGYFLIPALL